MTRPFELTATFSRAGELAVEEMLGDLYEFLPALARNSPLLSAWFLKGMSKEDALRYEVFNTAGPTPAAAAVLREELRNDVDPRIVGMWNGKAGQEGASLEYIGRPQPERCLLTLRAKQRAFATDWRGAVDLVASAVEIWRPSMACVETSGYFDRKVFKDRPGAGWMLYLPNIVTAQQVPEARKLVPVMMKNENSKNLQVGTIIVSTIDEPFSDDNPDHVKISNAIEIRLVDQDLLPRYLDL